MAVGILAAVGLITAVPASAAVASAQVSGVSWSGSSSSPTVTVTGSGFGRRAPASIAVSGLTSCGNFNGNDYKSILFEDDTANWAGGHYISGTDGNCVGLNISSWSSTEVVFTFADAYGDFGWIANSGDNFALGIKGYYWGGVINYGG
jgi:hypothetical protein